MGWIGCVRCENIQRDFVARTFALIAPVQPILHRVSCSNKIVPNAPKHYETHQNMSLGSDGVDRVDLLQKNLTQLCGLNFWINYNSSARFEASIVNQRNGPQCTQTLRNKTKHEFRVQWGGSGAFIAKNSDTTLWDELFHYLHRVSCSNEMVPNAPKPYEMHQNMSLGSDGMDSLDLLQIFQTQLCGLNFCINYNSLARFEPSIIKQ